MISINKINACNSKKKVKHLFTAVIVGIWCRSWTLQRHFVRASTGREHRWNILHRQRGFVRHMFPHPKDEHAYIRGSKSSFISHHVGCYDMFEVSRTTECGLTEARRQYGSVSQTALLHNRLCSIDIKRMSTISNSVCTGTHATNVWRQKYDGRLRPSTWKVSDRGRHVSRSNVDERGGWTDAERSEQELCLLCGMDSK